MKITHNALKQKETFNKLVDLGIYSIGTKHSQMAIEFVSDAIDRLMGKIDIENINLLDCGCGNGFWLRLIYSQLSKIADVRVMGFDISEQMIDLSQKNLADIAHTGDIKIGDILDPESYQFTGCDGMDFIFAYDIVQQLSTEYHYTALKVIENNLNPGGQALIFDHEKYSKYGIKMNLKKAVTKYFSIPLVPEYYCNATYPSLNKLKKKISKKISIEAEVFASSKYEKRLLVLKKKKYENNIIHL